MKLAIIGVGAMGSLFAAKLSPLADVMLLGNWREQLDALNREGLAITQLDGTVQRIAVSATSDPQLIDPVEVALILVKSRQTARAAQQAAQILNERGIALTLQNGIGNIECLRRVLGEERASLGVTSQGATMLGAGQVRHAGHGPTNLAVTPQTQETLSEVAELFKDADLETHLVHSVEALVWGKLAINTGINPLTALLRVPNGFLAENPNANAIMRRAAQETAAVARAQGIHLPFESAAERAHEVARATATNLSSMLQDVMRGVPTEIEAICGQVVAFGRRLHIATPVNEELLTVVRAIENSAPLDIPAHSPLAGVSRLVMRAAERESG